MINSNDWFDDGRGDNARFLTTYSPPRPSDLTLDHHILQPHMNFETNAKRTY